jgi:type VI secretion system protein ImpE
MNAQQFYREGDLPQAIWAALGEVKQCPADADRRGFLSELLCFAGDLDRADKQLDALDKHDPEMMLGIGLFRNLLRAEQARQQFYSEGRLPEFVGPPPDWVRLHLEASICLREDKQDEAVELLSKADAGRPTLAGTCNGRGYEDLRDLDDLTAGVFEVLTSSGKYYWIPIDRVELVEFRAPQRTRDLLWRRARMIVRDGPDGEVFLPVLYAGSHADAGDHVRLGRATEWRGGDVTPVRGVGQRTFLVGDEPCPILEIEALTIDDGPAR